MKNNMWKKHKSYNAIVCGSFGQLSNLPSSTVSQLVTSASFGVQDWIENLHNPIQALISTQLDSIWSQLNGKFVCMPLSDIGGQLEVLIESSNAWEQTGEAES